MDSMVDGRRALKGTRMDTGESTTFQSKMPPNKRLERTRAAGAYPNPRPMARSNVDGQTCYQKPRGRRSGSVCRVTSPRPAVHRRGRRRDSLRVCGWLGEGSSLIGDQFYLIAIGFITMQTTGSALALGTIMMTAVNADINLALPQIW